MGIYCGKKKSNPFVFLDQPLPGAPRHVVQSFVQISKNRLRRTNIKSNLTPKIEYTLKPSTYNAKA